MRLETLEFQGYFEEDPAQRRETLQIVASDDDMETDLLAWAILPTPETEQDDDARREYVFRYALGGYLRDGLFVLRVECLDRSRSSWWAEIAAGLVASPTSPAENRATGFTPFWFMKKRLHFLTSQKKVEEAYGSAAFGFLGFGSSSNLPHRRLFGATVG